MKDKNTQNFFRICTGRHVLALVSAAVIAVHLLTRGNRSFTSQVFRSVTRPVHTALMRFNNLFPFSVAELLIALALIGAVVYIIYGIIKLIKTNKRLKQVYITFVTLLSFSLFVYAGFCLLWGVYYYSNDFISESGLCDDPVSVEQLKAVTAYFAELSNEYSGAVERDENGRYITDRNRILSESDKVFENVEGILPYVSGPAVKAKGIHCSRIMSLTDFTGFFFPFTAEANVNTDFPPGLFASTVAHELSHQRGVAREQDANFVAVLASLEYGDPEYCYSAAMLAYTYLGNALYKTDYEAWREIALTLNDYVMADFRADSEYWAQFDTPVSKVSNTVYEGFLQSYGQELGLQSYGACVDLLVNYYYSSALERQNAK